jgi:citrate/tricarballylate utilization protein
MRSPDAAVDAVLARAPVACALRDGRALDPYIESRRAMEICNACRYCEGFCAVFPAMTRRRTFADHDLNYLANLCHNCRACYYSCPYTPPHEFAINVPRMFSELRVRSYEHYCFPAVMGKLFRGNGFVVAVTMMVGVAATLLLAILLVDPGAFKRPALAPGDFYLIIPYGVMVAAGAASAMVSIAALLVSGVRFWRDIAQGTRLGAADFCAGLWNALTLKNLGAQGNRGCNDRSERYSNVRRRLHHTMFYGFMLCFAATCVATIYDHFLGLRAPYALASLPVQLGLWGGIGLLIGSSGLLWLKGKSDSAVTSRLAVGSDYALLWVLIALSVTGLALLALRDTRFAGILLTAHLGVVFSFFLLLPYSKMVHGYYRLLALMHSAAETRDSKQTVE